MHGGALLAEHRQTRGGHRGGGVGGGVPGRVPLRPGAVTAGVDGVTAGVCALTVGVGAAAAGRAGSGRLSTTTTIAARARAATPTADHRLRRRLRERRCARATAARAASTRSRLISALVGRLVVAMDRASSLSRYGSGTAGKRTGGPALPAWPKVPAGGTLGPAWSTRSPPVCGAGNDRCDRGLSIRSGAGWKVRMALAWVRLASPPGPYHPRYPTGTGPSRACDAVPPDRQDPHRRDRQRIARPAQPGER